MAARRPRCRGLTWLGRESGADGATDIRHLLIAPIKKRENIVLAMNFIFVLSWIIVVVQNKIVDITLLG